MEKYPKHGEYIVFNPTPKKVSAGFDMMGPNGMEYVFEPYEEKKVYVKDHVHHITTSNKHINKGLVWLDYNESAKALYPTYEDFKRAKAAEGLERAIAHASITVTYEQQAVKAAELGGHLIEKRSMDVNKKQNYLDKLEETRNNMLSAKKNEEPEVEPEMPEWMGGKEPTKEPAERDKYGLLVGEEKEINGHKVKRFRPWAYMVDNKMVKTSQVEALFATQ